jgi:hypothetical protein
MFYFSDDVLVFSLCILHDNLCRYNEKRIHVQYCAWPKLVFDEALWANLLIQTRDLHGPLKEIFTNILNFKAHSRRSSDYRQ